MLTAKQHELLVFLQARLRETGVPPSFDEMAGATGTGKSGVHRLIKALEERGFIRRLPNRSRAIDVIKGPADMASGSAAPVVRFPGDTLMTPIPGMVEVEFLGPINSSSPQEVLVAAKPPIRVTREMAPDPKEFFAVEVRGNFMIEAGIHDGDRLLLRRCQRVDSGSIALTIIDDDWVMLRRVRVRGSSLALETADASYETHIYHGDRVRILGRVVELLRSYPDPEHQKAVAP